MVITERAARARLPVTQTLSGGRFYRTEAIFARFYHEAGEG